MQISVIDLQDVPIDTECVRRAAGLAAQTRAHDFESVSIVLVDDARITELNREHRGFDSPTDVLSYGSDEEDPEYMGDVLISVDTATRQAASAGRAAARRPCKRTQHAAGAAHARHAVQLARSNARCERYTSPAGDGLLLHMSTSEG